MPKKIFTSKIFFPINEYLSKKRSSAYLIGWNVNAFVSCIATVVPNTEIVQDALLLLAEREEIKNSLVGAPKILGEWIFHDANDKLERPDVNEMDIWITIEQQGELPSLKSINCYDYCYNSTAFASSQIIMFQKTEEYYYSVDSLQLDYRIYGEKWKKNTTKKKELKNIEKNNLENKNKETTNPEIQIDNENNLTELESCLQQINSAFIVEKMVFNCLSKIEQEKQKKNTNHPKSKINSKIFFSLNFFFSKMISLFLFISDFFFYFIKIEKFENLKKFSNLQQEFWSNNHRCRSLHINFVNSIMLTIIDIFFGIFVGLFLYSNSEMVLTWFWEINSANHQILRSGVLWLRGDPAGFKLNSNLDEFFASISLFYSDKFYEIITSTGKLFGNYILTLISCCGIFGVSIILRLALTCFTFFMLHVVTFYAIFAKLHSLQLQIMSSLWRLFRGKKYNPLRNRVDTCVFDVDQLLLGTLLFTFVFFLFPTVACYYIFFAILRAALGLVKVVVFVILRFLQDYPLYATVLYVIDPALLPGGIRFDVLDKASNKSCSYLVIRGRTVEPSVILSFFFHNITKILAITPQNNMLASVEKFIVGEPIQILGSLFEIN